MMEESRLAFGIEIVIVAVIMSALMVPVLWIAEAFGAEARPVASSELSWAAELQEVDEALARNNLSGAVRALHAAHVAALGSRRWDAMIAVGDASLRVGAAAHTRQASLEKARQAYLSALFRARAAGSIEGVLQTAQAFAALGDTDVVRQCISVARGLASRSRNADALARVDDFAAQFNTSLLTVGSPSMGPFD